ncbi:MAG: FHA domain-containing protein [Deltaproteobacteria bacterium]|nr:FHA domain-containing protein [Deltaproteobacteria bacterium]
MKLQIKDDSGRTHTVPLTRDEITIGRKEGNTIRLTERNVSRTHARFLKRGEEIHVEDLSRYGTRVNGERITETRRVGSGDVIQIGDYMISLEGVKPVDEAAAAATDAKLAAAGAAAAAAPAPAPAAEKKAPTGEKKAAPASKEGKDKAAKGEDKGKKEPTVPPGYAMKTMPEGSVSADEVRRSLGAGKKRIAAAHPTLVAVTTHLAGQEFPITAATMILGRTGENDLKVDHQSISSNHAKVVVSDGRVKMVDLKSKNGIRVNGEYWEESTLKSGDIIELGKVQFRFVDKGEEFLYKPEDYAAGAKPAGGAPAEGKSGSKAWLWILLLVLVGGGVAVVLAMSGGSKTGGGTADAAVVGTATTAPPTTAATTAPPTTAAATTAPPTTVATKEEPDVAVAAADTAPAATAEAEVQAGGDAQKAAKDEMLKKATEAAAAQKWDDAKKELAALLALEPSHAQAKALFAKVDAEKTAGLTFDEVQAAQAKNDLSTAWASLQKLTSLPTDSVYFARVQEVKNVLGPALANQLVDQGKAAFNRKQYQEAIAKAEEAKKLVFNHAEADDVIARARKKIREEANKPDPTKPDPTKPDPKQPDGKTGADLYKEARAIHNTDPKGALKLYEQAAAKGYPVAWKSIGSVKVKLNDTAGAIVAYKRYLAAVPSATDGEMVKDIITRLGGTP